jgi:hypothetical protein
MNKRVKKTYLFKLIRRPLQAFILGLCLANGGALAQRLPLPTNLIDLDSAEGEQLLIESQARRDYFPLSTQFVTQDNLAYCGVASMVMVLNALNIPAPETPNLGTFRMFTQENFFNEKTQKVLSVEVVSKQGMTLEQLGAFLETYPVDAQVYHAENSSLEEFRKLAIQNLKEPNNYLLVNYLRSTIGQERGGHISPVAAYHESTDRFLILDVSRYKYPPIWVSATDLWNSMNTTDSTSNKTRGFVLISPE